VTDPFDALRVACCVVLFPTMTLPKSRLEGVTLSSALAFVMPVPPADMESVEFRPVLTRVTLPCLHPEALGVKMTGSWTLAPGLSLTGRLRVPSEKPLPCADLLVILSDLLPVLTSV